MKTLKLCKVCNTMKNIESPAVVCVRCMNKLKHEMIMEEAIASAELATHTQTSLENRLELFDERFGDEHNGIGSNKNIIKTGQSMDELKDFLAESIQQAVEEERERVMGNLVFRDVEYTSLDRMSQISRDNYFYNLSLNQVKDDILSSLKDK